MRQTADYFVAFAWNRPFRCPFAPWTSYAGPRGLPTRAPVPAPSRRRAAAKRDGVLPQAKLVSAPTCLYDDGISRLTLTLVQYQNQRPDLLRGACFSAEWPHTEVCSDCSVATRFVSHAPPRRDRPRILSLAPPCSIVGLVAP